jgi:hypothetical protein
MNTTSAIALCEASVEVDCYPRVMANNIPVADEYVNVEKSVGRNVHKWLAKS